MVIIVFCLTHFFPAVRAPPGSVPCSCGQVYTTPKSVGEHISRVPDPVEKEDCRRYRKLVKEGALAVYVAGDPKT